jgi:hypothetical protein
MINKFSAGKGTAGYLDRQKKIEWLKVLLSFGLVLAIFFVGYFTTGTRKNLFTLVAILGCLPAAKILVGLITRFPYRSLEPGKAKEIREHAPNVRVLFDFVFTTYEKILPVESIVIYNNTICGYAASYKTDVDFAAKHLKKMMQDNGYSKVTVKIFHDYKAFLARAEGMSDIAGIEKADYSRKEEKMEAILKNISL